uniref:Uncharacterized protein n=1 Tax=Cannabis sativa TaxID=3483 RepID=A0A803NMS3_CANSA
MRLLFGSTNVSVYHSLKAKIRITSNPFYIASTRTWLRPHIASPTSLGSTHQYRLHQPFIISEGPFNEPTSDYGVQHLGHPQTTSIGFYMASSSHNALPPHSQDLNHPAIPTSLWAHHFTSAPPTVVAPSLDIPTSLHHPQTTKNNTVPSSPVTTAEQPLPKPTSTTYGCYYLTSTQPLYFAIGSTTTPAPTSTTTRKVKLKRPNCLNAKEFRKMLKRTQNLAKALNEGQVEEAGDAQRTRLES